MQDYDLLYGDEQHHAAMTAAQHMTVLGTTVIAMLAFLGAVAVIHYITKHTND